ncbi:alpha-L RNA-binding motif-containing protein [Nadsonia fulvescens var. elongata DSM 6958]|uniref:Small ribosomal subunit protein uS4m n=1 Tax=Nadsonia fulvescens var. elongata DSM 6958 TaxID=857566 RepID=A0A1E3PS22_9ASCO|nr:alpha-L RNA-binding motif-containing protein [Nadsonia fulvescens var. elongata DSM 6958]
MPQNKSFFSLTRGRVRASWNKWNLFNYYKKPAPKKQHTLYREKWQAKADTRAYHGEFLREGRWGNIFNPKLKTVAQLDKYLKKSSTSKGDSIQNSQGALSRESIKDVTPVVLQTYAALEKRLDIALFRAMFASSPRQARRFILGGHVKVNGAKVKTPAFTLSPGDVFSVNPEMVLLTLGKNKPSASEAAKIDNQQIKKFNQYIKKCEENPKKMWDIRKKHLDLKLKNDPDFADKVRKQNMAINDQRLDSMMTEIRNVTSDTVLIKILQSQEYFNKHGIMPDVFGKQIQKLSQEALELINGKETIPISSTEIATEASTDSTTDNIADTPSTIIPEAGRSTSATSQGSNLLPEQKDSVNTPEFVTPEEVSPEILQKIHRYVSTEFSLTMPEKERKSVREVRKIVHTIISVRIEQIKKNPKYQPIGLRTVSGEYKADWFKELGESRDLIDIESARETEKTEGINIGLLWQPKGLYGRADPNRPYFSPWAMRPFLAPWAIYPAHIEISFPTCHAVYMRDPVARPGQSEVISPFGIETHDKAYSFYVRKRL